MFYTDRTGKTGECDIIDEGKKGVKVRIQFHDTGKCIWTARENVTETPKTPVIYNKPVKKTETVATCNTLDKLIETRKQLVSLDIDTKDIDVKIKTERDKIAAEKVKAEQAAKTCKTTKKPEYINVPSDQLIILINQIKEQNEHISALVQALNKQNSVIPGYIGNGSIVLVDDKPYSVVSTGDGETIKVKPVHGGRAKNIPASKAIYTLQ